MRYDATIIWQRQDYMLEMSIKYAHPLTGKVRDDYIDGVWVFECSLYGIGEKDVRGVDDVRCVLIVKA